MTIIDSSQSEKSHPSPFTGQLARPRWFYRQWMLAGNPALFFDRIAQDYGDFVHYRGLLSFYQINHPALVKSVLMGTHKHYDKNSNIYRRVANAFGDGLVVSEGNKWKRQRKLMQPMFGPKTVKHFFDGMLTAVDEMAKAWDQQYAGGHAFNVAQEMETLTLQVAGQALFRDGFKQDADRIRQWTRAINHYTAKPPLPIIRQFWFPSSVNRKLKRTLDQFGTFIGKLISDRRSTGSQNDLLSILLDTRDEETGEPMSDVEITEEALGMIIGGHETTSGALTWLWWELHHNPDVESKLYQEIVDVAGDGPLTLDCLPKLKYTRMVIDECLRLHPPFWFENRNAKSDVELGGVTIPKGSLILFSRYTLHRHPDFWSDPERFDPNRHDPSAPENARTTYAQVPFGGGPRICIGVNFAVMELLVIVASLVRRYRISVASNDRHQMAAKMTMFPKHGVQVQLDRRR